MQMSFRSQKIMHQNLCTTIQQASQVMKFYYLEEG